MTPEAFDAACRALPAATMDILWQVEHVYKVGGRMFAVTTPGHGCSIKVTDIAFEALVETGRARPSPYLDWLATAHALVAAKLTRKQRTELGLTQP